MEFKYTTDIGTEVVMGIYTVEDIVAFANNKKLKCDGRGFSFNPKNGNPALPTDLKINGQKVKLEITQEIKEYILSLREDERIAKLPIKKQLKEKIKKLEKEFLYYVDSDLVTGQSYYTLASRHSKDVWNKIKNYFTYINTSFHSDTFDAMYGSNFKGYLTTKRHEVEAILREIYKIDNTHKINELKKELAKIENGDVRKAEPYDGEPTTGE